MHSQSSCDCYCKIREPTVRHRNEIQSDRSRVKLVTSRTSVSKADTIRSGRKAPFTPANPINDDQLDTKRSTVTLPISPVLSPETSAALEDVDRLVKDAEIQIKAINMATDCTGLRRPMNAYPDEISLDDENDQLLYVRERVAYKFQEANGWIDVNHAVQKNEEISDEGSVPFKPKKITDFSAPKFKTFEERYKEFPKRGPFGIQDLGIPSGSAQNKEGSKEPNEIPNLERNTKMNTFSVQSCPPVNIERELTAQNLESIHIPPDASFYQENANIGTYVASHNPWNRSQAPIRKEKFAKISEELNEATSNRKSSEKQKKKSAKASKDTENSVESARSSVSKEKSEVSEGSSRTWSGNNEEGAENVEKLDEVPERVAVADRNEEHVKSVAVEDVAVGPDYRKVEDREVQVEIEMVERKMNDRATKATISGKGEQKQVRFNEEVLERVEQLDEEDTKRNDKEKSSTSIQDVEMPEFIESEEDEIVLKENFDGYQSTPTSKAITVHKDTLALRKRDEKELKKKKKKISDAENREEEHFKLVDQRFANLLHKYCDRNEKNVEDTSVLASSSADSSGTSSGDSVVSDELYYPSFDNLDNVLQAYSKIIDDVSKSSRTIDEYLSRPELEEFLQHDVTAESSESLASVQFNRRKVEMPKKNPSYYLQPKQNTERRNKDLVKDHMAVKHEHTNKEHRSCVTMSRVKSKKSTPLKATGNNKHGNNSRYKPVLPKSSFKDPSQIDLKVATRFDSRTLLDEETELSGTSYGEIVKHIHGKESNTSKAPRLWNSSVFLVNDESSSSTSSTNRSSLKTDARSVSEKKVEEASEILIDSVAEEAASLRSNMASEQDVGRKEKGNFDYPPADVAFSDIFRQGFPGLTDATKITEHLIDRVLKEETKNIEDKIKNAFNVNEIIPVLMKSLLEHLQKDATSSPQNLELLISENVSVNNVESNIHEIETTRVTSPNESEKENLRTGFQADNVETIENNEKIADKNTTNEFTSENIKIDLVDKSASRNSNAEGTMSHSKNSIDELGKVNSNSVSLKELSGTENRNTDSNRSVKNTVEDSENLKQKGYSAGSVASAKNVSSIVDEKTKNKEDRIEEKSQSNVSVNTNERTSSKAVDRSSVKNDGAESIGPKGCSNEHFSVADKLSSKVENEKSLEPCLNQNRMKNSVKSDDNVQRNSSSDSLRDCASLRSSPRNEPKASSMMESVHGTNENEQVDFDSMNKAFNGIPTEISSQKGPYYNTFTKEKILSDLYGEMHAQLLNSTAGTNYSNLVQQDLRSSENKLATNSNKVEISSPDTSRSEGEFFLQSSGSYSLGEVKTLNADERDDDITIFVTKEMLTLWNESSKSLVQSLGEI
ncbi:uncharacterized protein LOC116426103 isoform X1 [Nomia melanderi]|uniref:uncharacterized protein LOC116426103 isoform X1 n=2 Tax=Nomia melanderi TaxID=2448451 RepID=UPI003FCE200F